MDDAVIYSVNRNGCSQQTIGDDETDHAWLDAAGMYRTDRPVYLIWSGLITIKMPLASGMTECKCKHLPHSKRQSPERELPFFLKTFPTLSKIFNFGLLLWENVFKIMNIIC